jgi:hypothetical protein
MANFFLLSLLLVLMGYFFSKQFKFSQNPVVPKASFSGVPHYIAGSTNGSPLSELGSHCGYKVVIDEKKAVHSALYSTITSFSAGLLQEFAVSLQSKNGETFFTPPAKRNITFHPYSIEEEAEDRGWTLFSKIFFLKTNVAILQLRIQSRTNHGTVRPAFHLLSPRGRNKENPYPHLAGRRSYSQQEEGLLLTTRHRIPGQALHTFFLPSNGESSNKGKLTGPQVALLPGEELTWSVIVSFSADCRKKAMAKAFKARENLYSLTEKAQHRWSRFEEQLPSPHTREDGQKEVYRLSAWALNNNLYASRNGMNRWASLPCKVYFPFIWGWDTPQQAIGISEWSPLKATHSLLNQLEANCVNKKEGARGQVPCKLSDSMHGVLNFYSQSPLQSWSALTISQRMKNRKKAKLFLKKMSPLLRSNLNWWEKNRQHPRGLFFYLNGMESGLDDSPRFYPRRYVPSFIAGLLPRNIRAVDLNCWLFQSYINSAYISREAGQSSAAKQLFSRSTQLAEIIDRDLWCEEEQAWLDRHPDGSFVNVLTPVVWWPAFVGATLNLSRIKTVIEKHLLDDQKFWGKHGIPSVSFSDPTYNHRQDGYYWRGQIWLINTYSALEVLFRYGYTKEAEELRQRILTTLAGAGGIYETYNALTGERGWSSRGPGDPAAFQFGMSSAWAMQILLSRYQQFRYLFNETQSIEGYIRCADVFGDYPHTSPPGAAQQNNKAMLYVETPGHEVPHMSLQSADGKSLTQSSLVDVQFTDPYNNFHAKNVTLYWQGNRFNLTIGVRHRLTLSVAVNY